MGANCCDEKHHPSGEKKRKSQKLEICITNPKNIIIMYSRHFFIHVDINNGQSHEIS